MVRMDDGWFGSRACRQAALVLSVVGCLAVGCSPATRHANRADAAFAEPGTPWLTRLSLTDKQYAERPKAADLRPPDVRGDRETEDFRTMYLGHVREHTPFRDVVWDTPLRGQKIVRLTYSRDGLFAETATGRVYLIDRTTGMVRWMFDVGDALDYPPAPMEGMQLTPDDALARLRVTEAALAEAEAAPLPDTKLIKTLQARRRDARKDLETVRDQDVVVLLSRGTCYALDGDGNLRWKKYLKLTPSTAPRVLPSQVVVGDLAGHRAYSFDPYSGDISGWFTLRGMVLTQPVYFGNLYFADDGGAVSCYTQTGEQLWTYQTEQSIRRPMEVTQERVYVASEDMAVYCLERSTGRMLWKNETQGRVVDGPRLAGEQVFYRTESGKGLTCAVATTGDVRWTMPLGVRPLFRGRNYLYVLGQDNWIYLLDADSGKVHRKVHEPHLRFLLSEPAGDILYGATADGFLFALKESPARF